MDLEKEIKSILFEIGKEVKLHKLDDDNIILEIDYEKYTADLMRILKDWLSE